MNLSRALSLQIDTDHDVGLDFLPLNDLRGPLNEDDIAFLEAWVDFAAGANNVDNETDLGYGEDIEVRLETLVLATRKFALTQRLTLLKADDVPSGPQYKTYGNAVFSPRASRKAFFSRQLFFNPLFGAPFDDGPDAKPGEEDEDVPLLRCLRQAHLSYEYEALMRADMRDLEAHDLIHWTPDELVDAALARDFNKDNNGYGNDSDIDNEPQAPITPRSDDCSVLGDCNNCSTYSSGSTCLVLHQKLAHLQGNKRSSAVAVISVPTADCHVVEGEICPSPGTPAARCTTLSCRRVCTAHEKPTAEGARLMEEKVGSAGGGGAAAAVAAPAAPSDDDVDAMRAAAAGGRSSSGAAAPAVPAARAHGDGAAMAAAEGGAAAAAVDAAAAKSDAVDGGEAVCADDDAAWRCLLDGSGQLPYEYEALMCADMRDLDKFDLIHWTPDELVEAALTRSFCPQPPAPTDPWVISDVGSPEKLLCPAASAAVRGNHDDINAKASSPEDREGGFRWLGDSGWYGNSGGGVVVAGSFHCTAPKASEWSSTLALLAASCLSVPTDFCSKPVRPSTPDGSCILLPRSFPRASPAVTAVAEVTGTAATEVTAAAAAAAARTVGWMMASGTFAGKGSETFAGDGRVGEARVGDCLSGGCRKGGSSSVGGGDGSVGDAVEGDSDEDNAAWNRFLGSLDELPYEYEALMRADMCDLEGFHLIYWTPDELVEAALAREGLAF